METNPTPKVRTKRLTNDTDVLKKLVSLLEKEKLTKEELAKKLSLDNVKKLNDSVFLAAIKLSGNSKFLENLVEKAGGRVRKNSQYLAKRGLLIQPWQFIGRNIADGQRYSVTFGRKGSITLTPTDEAVSGVGKE